jgi:prepilin-type processing-associated H-X9-DG protein
MSSNITAGGGHSPADVKIDLAHPNAVAAGTTVQTILCPSDIVPTDNVLFTGTANTGCCSYTANVGWPSYATGYNGERSTPGAFNGVIPLRNPSTNVAWHSGGNASSRDIIDGLSNTCMISERLIQNGTTLPTIRSYDRRLLSYHVSESPRTLAQIDHRCHPDRSHADLEYSAYIGRAWILGWSPAGNTYMHLKTPNSMAGHFSSSDVEGDFFLSPSSRHPNGVNAVYADGSTHFIPDSIDPVLWWGLGSRAAGEILDTF